MRNYEEPRNCIEVFIFLKTGNNLDRTSSGAESLTAVDEQFSTEIKNGYAGKKTPDIVRSQPPAPNTRGQTKLEVAAAHRIFRFSRDPDYSDLSTDKTFALETSSPVTDIHFRNTEYFLSLPAPSPASKIKQPLGM